ncbi:MAG: YqeG family HAD IIIA-type phosphatase [Bacilli bacterium]
MENFIPDIYQKNIYSIDYDSLKQNDIKCILFDLNNTIVPYNSTLISNKLKLFIDELKLKGFKIIILSNSTKNRIRKFKNELNLDSAAFSLKPSTRKLKKIMKLYNFKYHEMCIIGDTLITDISSGNRFGILTILVNSMSTKVSWHKKPINLIENIIRKRLTKKDKWKIGEYYEL